MHYGFIAPEEYRPTFYHSFEKLLVRAFDAFSVKWSRIALEQTFPQKHVPRPSLRPTESQTCGVLRSIEESSFNDPPRDILIEVRHYRPQNPRNIRLFTNLEERKEPLLGGKLVIIDERYIFSFGVFNASVPRHRDILLRLDNVSCGYARVCGELRYDRFGGLLAVIVYNNDRIREQTLCILSVELPQKLRKKIRSLISADTDADVT